MKNIQQKAVARQQGKNKLWQLSKQSNKTNKTQCSLYFYNERPEFRNIKFLEERIIIRINTEKDEIYEALN